MKSAYPLVPLGDILRLDRDEVKVLATDTYRIAGMYSFGLGLFERPALSGADIGYRSLFQLHEGQLIMSRLNGWEGAMSVVGPEHDQCFVSNEYPTFSIDRSRVLPAFISHICRWPWLWEALRDRARGMGSTIGARRLRVRPDHLLSIEVPLPEIQEQDRIVQRIDELAHWRNGAEALLKSAVVYPTAILTSARASMVSPDGLRTRMAKGWRETQLGEVANFINGTSYDSNQLRETGTPIIRISNISDPSSQFLYTTQDFNDRFTVNKGDLLVSWSASFKSIIWPGPRGVLNQHIFVVTERDGTHRRFLRHLIEAVFDDMRTQEVGMGMMHLRRDAFLKHQVVVPDLPTQRMIAESLDRIEERVSTIRKGQQNTASLMPTLRVSILNHAFAGSL